VVNRRFREVDRWFRSHDREWPFSFERICEVLSLDAALIRSAIDGEAGARQGPIFRREHAEAAERPPHPALG
jgi:hypothetical protein